jgi:hypothetical protein
MALKILHYRNYITMIEKSRNSKMFRQAYILENDKGKDILKNGELSCAYYVSSILKIFDLISCLHSTVDGLVKDLKKSGWQETKKLEPGNILIWQEKKFKNGSHKHIGFYINQSKAISHDSSKKMPAVHHYTFGQADNQPKRKIVEILTHNFINKS